MKTDILSLIIRHFIKKAKFQKSVDQRLENYLYFNALFTSLASDETIWRNFGRRFGLVSVSLGKLETFSLKQEHFYSFSSEKYNFLMVYRQLKEMHFKS